MSYLLYAEELRKTVNLEECTGCEGLSFAHEGGIDIPFCKNIWFGGKCERKSKESQEKKNAIYKAERYWKV